MKAQAALLGAASAILLAAAAGFFPAVQAARACAPDGDLSATYAGRLQEAQWCCGALLMAAGLLLPVIRRALPGAGRWLEHAPDRVVLPLLALATIAQALVIQYAWFGNVPHVTDALSHLFQAKIFSLGRVDVPTPACPLSFHQMHVLMTSDGHWFSKYPPGHALLLALGLRAHLLPLVVPLAAGAITAATAFLAAAFFGRTTGRLAGLLLACSPLHVLLGASFMSHSTFLACFLGGLCLLTPALRVGGPEPGRQTLAGGLLIGYSLLIRPQDFALCALLTGLAVVLGGPAAWRRGLRASGWFLAGFLPLLLALLAWNAWRFGHPLSIGYNTARAGVLVAPFADQFGFSEFFRPAHALRITAFTLLRFDSALLGWPTCLFICAFALLHRDRRDLFCLLAVGAVVAFYFCYAYYGVEYEARYYLLAAPPAAALLVRGAQALARRGVSPPLLAALALASAAYAFLHYWPRALAPTYRAHYEYIEPRLAAQAEEAGLERALVLLPSAGLQDAHYGAGFLLNDPLLQASVIYARALPDQLDCLRAAYADRRLLLYRAATDSAPAQFEPLRPDLSPP